MINLDFRDPRPIYEQIIEKISDLAARGVFEADVQLPSVRQLATELSINPNTIQRAYSELEKRGIIYSLKGKGNFVSPDLDNIRLQKQTVLLKKFGDISREAFSFEIPFEQLKCELCKTYELFSKEVF